MTEGSIDLQALARRLEKVEIRSGRLKLWGIFVLLILLPGGVIMERPSVPDEIKARKIILVDKNGIARLKIELENGTPQITLVKENGDPNLLLSGEELCFYDQENKPRIIIMAKNTVDASCLSITDKQGKNCVKLSAGPEGPYLSINDNEEQKEVVLSIEPIGSLDWIERSYGDRLPRARQ
jgi:hypothetical protein